MKNSEKQLVNVGESRFGQGLFARQDLTKNQPLFRLAGKILTLKETIAMGDNECYCLQIDINKYILPGEPFMYSNHSCSPNCGISANLQFIAIKEIKAGEELAWDYSTSMLERHWTMDCECKSPECRKKILDFDLIPLELQLRYLSLKVVSPYICGYLSRKDITYYSNVKEERMAGKMLTTWGNHL